MHRESRSARNRWTTLGIALGIWAALAVPVQLDAESPAEEDSQTGSTIDIPNVRVPFAGVLSGGQPSREHLKQLADAGYETVIDLRGVGEFEEWDEKAEVEGLGMTYVSIPVASGEDLTEAKARAFAEALDKAEFPVLVHCASGNRVGALYALKAFHVDGATPEAALAVGEHAGMTRLAPTVRQRLGLPAEASTGADSR